MAHRGGAALAPENTMEAFRMAVECWRCDVLELDVRATRDGRVVVLHDQTVDRTTNGSGAIEDLTWAEVRQLDAGFRFHDLDGRHSARGKGVRIPLFDEVLEAFPGMRLNVEAKAADAASALVEAIARHGAEPRTLVAAEAEASRHDARGYRGPWGASGEQLRRFSVAMRLPIVGRCYTPRVDVFQVPDVWKGKPVVTPRLMRAAHARNIPVHVWTVDDPVRMHALLDLGVDGIQTDRPDLLDGVFKERGLR